MTKRLNDSPLFNKQVLLGLPKIAQMNEKEKMSEMGYNQDTTTRQVNCVGCGGRLSKNIWCFPSFECSAYMSHGSVKKQMYHKACALKRLRFTMEQIKLC